MLHFLRVEVIVSKRNHVFYKVRGRPSRGKLLEEDQWRDGGE